MRSDVTLQKDVQEELKWEPSVNAAHIGVSVKEGVVTLSGHVPSLAEKVSAERAVKRVYGVRAVADELDVKISGSSKRTDEDIALACVNAFESNPLVPKGKIKPIVNTGWVTIEGEVEWRFQEQSALQAVRSQAGVRGVSSQLKIRSRVSPDEVKHKIEAAFARSAEIDARRIQVDVEMGAVTLRGHVRSWAEHDEAQRAAWAAPGVTSVANELVVTP